MRRDAPRCAAMRRDAPRCAAMDRWLDGPTVRSSDAPDCTDGRTSDCMIARPRRLDCRARVACPPFIGLCGRLTRPPPLPSCACSWARTRLPRPCALGWLPSWRSGSRAAARTRCCTTAPTAASSPRWGSPTRAPTLEVA
eukprot:184394-Prymnesium_polylepis.1